MGRVENGLEGDLPNTKERVIKETKERDGWDCHNFLRKSEAEISEATQMVQRHHFLHPQLSWNEEGYVGNKTKTEKKVLMLMRTSFRNSNKTQFQTPFSLLNPKHPPLHPPAKGVVKELEKEEEEMLQLFFTVAFSTVPLTLYVPPIRSFNLFVETMEYVVRESRSYRSRVYPRLRGAWSRMLNFMLCNNNTR
ncbi:unnamed protein product [Sphenostylis stenocarpa]|uniref:Uncharacterized protein n=1 Tax=Sphenostylis stenocarpa TaxID=92480 RepID=A0AA86W4T4_9FABA|nr:unnamed protein product [Sphenostylis stenocarpa]